MSNDEAMMFAGIIILGFGFIILYLIGQDHDR